MVVIMIIGKLNLILCTSSYNSNDYLLAAYLIKKSNQIESIKMVDILKDTKVSKSTLLRFSVFCTPDKMILQGIDISPTI